MTKPAQLPIISPVRNWFLIALLVSLPALGEELPAEPSVHPTYRFGISGGYGDFGTIGGIEARAMLHDLMETGHNANHYGIGEIGNVRLSWQSQPSRLRVDEITLLRLGSFAPRDVEEEKEWSYLLSLGMASIRDSSCTRCLSGNLEFGYGPSFALGEKSPFLVFALLSADVSLSSGFSDFFRLGVGPQAGFRLFLARSLVFMTEGYYRYRVGTPYHNGHYGRSELRWNLSKKLAIWLRGEKHPDAWEGRLGTFLYF